MLLNSNFRYDLVSSDRLFLTSFLFHSLPFFSPVLYFFVPPFLLPAFPSLPLHLLPLDLRSHHATCYSPVMSKLKVAKRTITYCASGKVSLMDNTQDISPSF